MIQRSANGQKGRPHSQEWRAARTAGAIFLAHLAIVALLLAGAWAYLADRKNVEEAQQKAELATLSRALEEHTVRAFGQVDAAVLAISTVFVDTRGKQPRIDVRLPKSASTWFATTPQLAALFITTPDGQVLFQQARAQRSAASIPPQAALQSARARADKRLVVSPPLGRGQDAFIPVTRAVLDTRGEVVALVGALLSVRYFEDFYREAHAQPEDQVALVSRDAVILAAFPESATWQLPPPSTSTGVRVERWANGEQLVAKRVLNQYPLAVMSARPLSAAVAHTKSLRRQLVVGSLLLALLLTGIGYVGWRDLRRREASRAALARANAALEARIGRRTAELEQSNRELVAFSYSISHDLRAPLRGINGFANALREDFGERLDVQGREYLDRICRASVRMGNLIDELLSLANLSRQPLAFRRIDLSGIAQEIADDLRVAEPGREVQVEIQAGIRVEGDEALLRNALSNLLHNAWKFTRARRPAVITVTATTEHDMVRCTVADNGVGFEMSHAKRLFQPFQQLHGDQGFGGTGIGLASVRRIIERHGGHIWAEAQAEHGASFTFELPRYAAVMRRRGMTAADQT